ncbi:MAG: HAD family hydrolase [Alloprevotella sp.]|nr:HAD family hydrolase [Alloprevotella sp.]
MKDIKAIILDYGGTIDTGGRHWARVLREAYDASNVPITDEQFREAYVFGERALAKAPIVKKDDDFRHLLLKKVDQEIAWLEYKGYWNASGLMREAARYDIASFCDNFAREQTSRARAVIETLSKTYKLVLVSNFYGNIHTVLAAYKLDQFFPDIIESSVVGVRKPDPRIWKLGVNAAGCTASQCCVVGDNFRKDIAPAKSIGCKTIWFKGEAWDDNEEVDETKADAIITNIDQLLDALKL